MTSRLTIQFPKAIASITFLAFGFITSYPNHCLAQSIRLDGTLGPTRELAGKDYLIKQSDGRTAGQNLFHSFQKFNLDPGEAAIFESGAGIRNILSRVTGGFQSEINGLIKTNPGVNLFLINPSGIIFGESAQLDIGGSFVATTANAVRFGNQGFFDASIPNDPGLLKINPSALVFNQPGAKSITNISQADAGKRLNVFNIETPIVGLKVHERNSLILVGGDLILDKGGLNALDGRIELAAIAGQGEVKLNIEDAQLSLSVLENLARADIWLKNGSTLDTSGEGEGNIRIYGKNIQITGRSLVRNQFYGSQAGGSIMLDASDTIMLVGERQSIGLLTQLSTQAQSTGMAGSIEIKTKDLSLKDGAFIETNNLSTGAAGNVTINASGTVSLSGFGDTNPGSNKPAPSSILSANFDFIVGGEGGDISIKAGNLLMKDSATISTSGTFSDISGERNLVTGDSGNITISVDLLKLDNGSSVLANSSLGQTSNINIRARDVLLRNVSVISASAEEKNLKSGGNVFITTNRLDLADNSKIIAEADKGPGGNIIIQAQTLNKDSSRNISADSARSTDGRVILNTLEFSPKNLATILVDQTNQISEECVPIARPGVSSFAVIGRGGVPASPEEPLSPENVWVDWATLPPAKATHHTQPNAKSSPSKIQDSPATLPQPPTEIVEAQSWVKNAKGEIYLVAAAPGRHTGPMVPACK
jgi:filamentous hemagglutinin family protein